MTTLFATSEPTRLREEHGENSSSLERALLRAGSSYKTSPQTRAKVLAGLGLAAGSSALLTGSAAASVSVSAAKLTWTKLLLGVSLVGATAVPVGYYAVRTAESHKGTPASNVATPTLAVPESTPAQAAPAARAASTNRGIPKESTGFRYVMMMMGIGLSALRTSSRTRGTVIPCSRAACVVR